MRFALVLDTASSTPLHRQIYNEWRQGILDGRFRRGEQVPSTRELALAMQVSRATVTAAYEQLIAEGYLDATRGSGTFICHQLPDDLRHAKPTPAKRREDAPVRLSRYGAGLQERYCESPKAPGVINFSQWRPDLAQFPFEIWHKLIKRQLNHPNPVVFDYAGQSTGFGPLRQEIAAYVARSRAVRCTPDQVIVVNGSQQGLDLCVRLLLDPGDEMGFENPGYQGARQIFTAHGARLQPISVDADGLVVQQLKPGARMVYVTPSHQFPTGVSMSLTRRLELLQWAGDTGAVILEDDYDSEYRFSGSPLPSLQGLSAGVPVIYIGTFSKVMFPGLRIGYVIAPPNLTEAFSRAKWLADRQTSLLEQAALADFLSEGHLERHIRRMRRLYGSRRDALIEALTRHFGDRVSIFGDPAGMHLLARFADSGLMQRAESRGVLLGCTAGYYLTRPPRGEFVLGFSAISERTIREGVKRIAP